MLEAIFVRRKVFLLALLLLSLVGLLVMRELPVQLYPQTQRPRVLVRISHSGYTALDFSRRYGSDLESRFLAIDGVSSLEVEYETDSSDFTLTFDWNTDSDQAKSDVESAMNSIRTLLPEELRDDYFVRFFTGENAGFLLLGIRSPSVSPKALYSLLKSSLENELSRVEDAETVEIMNIEDLEVEVELRQEALLAYGLTINDVDQAFRSGYLPRPLGAIKEAERNFSVRFVGETASLYELEQLPIRRRGDVTVRLADVAEISFAYTLPSRALVIGGTPAIRINATPKDGGNIRQMSEDIQTILKEALDDGILPADTLLQLYVDPAEYINRSILNVVRAALLGAALAMLIVLVTLGELRNTLLIGLSIPITLILTFILMRYFEVTINLISLGGIALAVGMVIDPAIVVLENIHRHYGEAVTIETRESLRRLIVRSVGEVAVPVAASTLTTVLVFLPITFTAPLTNAILGDQAGTVIFALVLALILSLTLIPIVAEMVHPLKKPDVVRRRRGLADISDLAMHGLSAAYCRLLRFVIRTRGRALTLTLFSFLLLAASLVFLLPGIPREIISPPSSNRIVIFFRSSEVDERETIVEEIVPAMENRIDALAGEIETETFALVSGRFNILFINFVDSDEATALLGDLQREFVSDNQFYYNVSMWDPAQLPLPRTNDLQISLSGPDEARLVLLLEEIRDLVNESDLYARVSTDPPTGLSNQIAMRIRPEVLDGFSELTEAGLTTLTGRILRGSASIEFELGQDTLDVAALFPEELLDSREKLANFLIFTREGIVPLKHFFEFSESSDAAGIASEDGEHIFRVYARMPSGSAAAERGRREESIKDLLQEKLELPAGYTATFDNPQAEMDASIRSLFVALAASMALIYLVLTLQFNSLTMPLVILVTVPLGFIGVVVSLYVFGSSLSLNSLLGTILLSGIVVNNAIIMIDFYLRMARQLETREEAIIRAAGLRFPPILITMLTTILGMLPLAIGLGEGSNIVQPLGIAVSGGLFISTLFTLFVVPALLRLKGGHMEAATQ